MNATATRPSLETMAGLYEAAQQSRDLIALARIRESIDRHGYTEEQVKRAVAPEMTQEDHAAQADDGYRSAMETAGY